jgi:hypothetical protein
MKPICVNCQRFYRPRKNGVYFVEMAPKHPGAAAGRKAPHAWRPYKVWCGDLWLCPDCGHELIIGVPTVAVSEQFKPDFQDTIANREANWLEVKDC